METAEEKLSLLGGDEIAVHAVEPDQKFPPDLVAHPVLEIILAHPAFLVEFDPDEFVKLILGHRLARLKAEEAPGEGPDGVIGHLQVQFLDLGGDKKLLEGDLRQDLGGLRGSWPPSSPHFQGHRGFPFGRLELGLGNRLVINGADRKPPRGNRRRRRCSWQWASGSTQKKRWSRR